MNAVLVTLLLGLQAPGQEVAPTTEPVVAPELLDWSDGLTLADLDAREAFLDGILADARRSPERCEELTLWLTTVAAGSDDLAWTARLAKRELQRSPFGDPLLGLLGGEHQVDVLFVGTTEGLAEDLSITFEATPGDLLPSGVDASTGEGMEELEAWAKGVVEHTNRFPVANLSSLGDWTLELRMGPDWTQLRLKEAPEPVLEVDGGSEGQLWLTRVREYNGRTLADIVGRNPDLVGLLPFEVPGVVAGSSAPRTDILGVFTRKVGADLCSALGLEPGCGLEVVRVKPGTVAEVLGISPGSVVLEVCGTEVHGDQGIQHAMSCAPDRHPGCGLCVVWIDAFGRQHQRTWKGSDGTAPAVPEAPPEVAPGLKPVGG